jgi:cell division protein FtsB
MRDIGRRIRRYRLTRYAVPGGAARRPPGWVWIAMALWLAWVGFLSDHSLYRIWRMGAENARTRRELAQARREIDRLDREARDPKARLRDAERALRREGFARPGEIIYRIDGGRADSLPR